MIYSCSPTRETLNQFLTPNDLEELFKQRFHNLKTIYASGNITIESPEFTNSANCKVNIIYPDTLFMELKGIFGISIATILLTSDKYIFYNQIDNKIIKGDINSLQENPYFNFELTPKEIIDFFAGTFFYNYVDYNSSIILKDENVFIVEYNTEYFKRRVWVNTSRLQVDKIAQYDIKGENVFEGSAKNYDKKLNLPLWSRIIIKRKRSILTLSYSEIKLNEFIDFQVPKKISELFLQ